MEEVKQNNEAAAPQEEQRVSYEQLKDIASNLHVQNQRLAHENEQMRKALENREFDYSSFFLSMLFKVLEHPNRYDDKFIHWCTNRIKSALISFDEAANAAMEEEKKQAESNEKQDEA